MKLFYFIELEIEFTNLFHNYNNFLNFPAMLYGIPLAKAGIINITKGLNVPAEAGLYI